MPDGAGAHPATACLDCGTELGPSLLSCPNCRRLVHAERLRRLAEEAERAQASGDTHTALGSWRAALDLLPPDSLQSHKIGSRVAQLSRELDGQAPAGGAAAPATGAPPKGSAAARWLAPLGVVGLLLWKLKFVLGFVLTKGKLLLLGLTKASTFFSMLLSLGVYWTAWGWRFALGLVGSLYVHEMGHVAALRRLGIRATAPMFVPGLGAYVRLHQYPVDAREDARVGLAGPIWGLGAALAAYGVYLATGTPIWGAIARVGAWINLFNLLPVWQLDGSRGFRALSRGQRWIAVLVLAAAWVLTHEGLLLLLALAAGLRTLGGRGAEVPDRTALLQYILLVATLSLLGAVQVPL